MFLHDARRFFLKNRHIADIAPLQLYCSGLIFAPTGSIIRKTFGTQIPKWISKLPKVRETWDAELEILEAHRRRVSSVAFSADGQWLASAGFCDTIDIWDLATGTIHQTFEDHGWVQSVSFSPDMRWLVSGSGKGIKVWDLATGMRQELGGHYWVESIVVSPDGQWLVSGSRDNTIRIWYLTTGTLHKTLEAIMTGLNQLPSHQMDSGWHLALLMKQSRSGTWLLALCTRLLRAIMVQLDQLPSCLMGHGWRLALMIRPSRFGIQPLASCTRPLRAIIALLNQLLSHQMENG